MKPHLLLIATLIACTLPVLGSEVPSPIMGRWQSPPDAAPEANICAEVVSLGGESYRVQFFQEFFKRAHVLNEFTATAKDGKIAFDQDGWNGEIAPDAITGNFQRKDKPPIRFSLTKSDFRSPTLGLAPPAGATVLFDGKTLEAWESKKGGTPEWKILPGGVAEVVSGRGGAGTITTKENFGDIQLHLEFRLPYQSERSGQGRSNSGVFLQGLYEVQILDSFGSSGLWNDCGALYELAPPKVNASLPPAEWQTYDIFFRAARFKPDGSVADLPRVTVRHNGVLIHHNEEISRPTKGNPVPPPLTGPIILQDHGNPVQFRNIWVAPLEGAEAS